MERKKQISRKKRAKREFVLCFFNAQREDVSCRTTKKNSDDKQDSQSSLVGLVRPSAQTIRIWTFCTEQNTLQSRLLCSAPPCRMLEVRGATYKKRSLRAIIFSRQRWRMIWEIPALRSPQSKAVTLRRCHPREASFALISAEQHHVWWILNNAPLGFLESAI